VSGALVGGIVLWDFDGTLAEPGLLDAAEEILVT
jgi:hypothetical protein